MRGMDWQLVLFVGTSLMQEYWLYFGLPRVYFWDVKSELYRNTGVPEDEDHRAA
ncbi:hypothetical protein [Sediminibacillus halophilus]|uniref:Uncharacterized protein n=1 Tax=Sediminibacillus halophilus TaxID=482461 RepID=A0A1G9V9V8_9BACI|nr:hypothetical protein [Sediminibacillus halophilus]SDM68982.1 hypothetical protein SAMN05216244_3197 [Sediminibacillus halophilus]